MELTIFKRTGKKQSDLNKIRWEKNIPAIVYSSGMPNENIYISGAEFNKILRELKEGELSTTIFTLKDGNKTFKAIVKGIEYNKTDYAVIHLDFMRIFDDKQVVVRIPVNCIGVNECKGLKLGGIFRQILRGLKVKCLPKDMPKEFVIDVTDMEITHSRAVNDLAMPKGVSPILRNPKEVIVVIGKR
ncbi:MAG: 50S ribosomal protein L25 [Chlamydiae bacterium]|nr:50S ribosomal protein L25 [Chlamydiota bacterium]